MASGAHINLDGHVVLVTGASREIGAAIAYRLAQVRLPAPVEARARDAVARAGRVVLVSSVAACTGGLVGPHYTSSKASLS